MKKGTVMGNDSRGIRLLKKGKKGLFRLLFSRIGVVTILILAQAFIMIMMIQWLNDYFPHFYSLYLFWL